MNIILLAGNPKHTVAFGGSSYHSVITKDLLLNLAFTMSFAAAISDIYI